MVLLAALKMNVSPKELAIEILGRSVEKEAEPISVLVTFNWAHKVKCDPMPSVSVNRVLSNVFFIFVRLWYK